MSAVTKNLLLYADGRVEVLSQCLEGLHYIKSEDVDGDWWQRTFDIDYVKDPTVAGGYVAVAREVSFVKTCTREERARRDAEFRAQTMRKCLWGIANYPGDEEEP